MNNTNYTIDNNNILFFFLIMILILYIISIKKNNTSDNFTDLIDVFQDKQIKHIKQKLKD